MGMDGHRYCERPQDQGRTEARPKTEGAPVMTTQRRRSTRASLLLATANLRKMQLRELREYCERRGSGAKYKRPQLDRMMADAHERRFDVVAVWKFDRFARSVSHLLRALDTFRVLGIEFVSISESLDTATPAGRMVFTVLGAVAELERSLIAERVRAGLRNAKAKGRKLGRPRVAVDATRVIRLRASGLSWPKIARELGVSVGTVYAVGRVV